MATYRDTYFSLLKENNKYLNKSTIVSLLMDEGGFSDRMKFYSHFNDEVKNPAKLNQNVDRVRNGEPLQYVLGYAYFLGEKYIVNEDVLIPRQETEQLAVETILYIKRLFNGEEDFVLADVATGSGCIAGAIKREFNGAKIYASDISKKAIDVAKTNLKDLDIEILEGNLLDPFIEKGIELDVLVSNPPYIDNVDTIDPQVFKYEPHSALLATPSSKFYEEMFIKMPKVMNKKHFLATFEIGEDMEEVLTDLIEKHFECVRYKFIKDLYGKTRFLIIIK